jgi:hypothetical protein
MGSGDRIGLSRQMIRDIVPPMHCQIRRQDMVIVMSRDAGSPAGWQERLAGFASRLLFRARQAVRPVLDGLGRLGIAPWELFVLAAYAADFLVHRLRALGRAKDKGPGEVRILWIVRITEIEITAVQPAASRPATYLLSPVEVSGGSGRSEY